MKPSVTIDERGVLVHLTDAEGKGVAIPLDPEGLLTLAAGAQAALLKVKGPGGLILLAKAARDFYAALTKDEPG